MPVQILTAGFQLDKAENQKKWEISRRRFIQMAGMGGAATAAIALIPNVIADKQTDTRLPEHVPDVENGRIRKWMMIIDQRKCDGCQSQDSPPKCTAACITGHYVPEPMQWIEVYEHEISKDPELQPGSDITAPIEGTTFFPTPCQQCQNPPCVNVCPVGATWTTPEGVTLIDQERCIGCRMCMAACPYERRFFTWSDPPVPPEALFVKYDPTHQVPLKKGVVAKCDFCPEMARSGQLPYCAQACPQGAIYYGDLEEDVATNGEEVVKVSRFLAENSAFRYKEELGTRPRVYYIPGHGEEAGRKPTDTGLKPTVWNHRTVPEGARKWKRSGR
ncbi:MAG: 4Fe-4S dicluster domain-containing protein [Chloroflexi bacterium]|nr:4Fe-4S dicluster domain-containing protein [Chloroflexota bacterium]